MKETQTLPTSWVGVVSHKWVARGVAVILLAIAIAGIGVHLAPKLLCVDSGRSTADVIIVLGGDSQYRPARAAELFHQGVAPAIVVSGNGDCEANREELIKAGIPGTAIAVECTSGNTKENAQFTVSLLRRERIRRAVIVTSWFHSRRALSAFRFFAPDIIFDSRPTYRVRDWSGWASVLNRVYVFQEYLKTLWYSMRYAIFPVSANTNAVRNVTTPEQPPREGFSSLHCPLASWSCEKFELGRS